MHWNDLQVKKNDFWLKDTYTVGELFQYNIFKNQSDKFRNYLS